MIDHSKAIQETLHSIGFDKNKSYPHKHSFSLLPEEERVRPNSQDLEQDYWTDNVLEND
jgi:hypothetical protein